MARTRSTTARWLRPPKPRSRKSSPQSGGGVKCDRVCFVDLTVDGRRVCVHTLPARRNGESSTPMMCPHESEKIHDTTDDLPRSDPMAAGSSASGGQKNVVDRLLELEDMINNQSEAIKAEIATLESHFIRNNTEIERLKYEASYGVNEEELTLDNIILKVMELKHTIGSELQEVRNAFTPESVATKLRLDSLAAGSLDIELCVDKLTTTFEKLKREVLEVRDTIGAELPEVKHLLSTESTETRSRLDKLFGRSVDALSRLDKLANSMEFMTGLVFKLKD